MLEDLSVPVKQIPCRIRTLKEELSPKDAEILEAAVMNPEWGLKTLSNELAKRGAKASDSSIKRHREKACSCWKI